MNLSPFDHALTTYHKNSRAIPGEAFPDSLQWVLGDADCTLARKVIEGWDGYQITPLHSLDKLAGEIGIGHLYYKDESSRFGLGSFKALGGAYAVLRLLAKEISGVIGKPVSDTEIGDGTYAEVASRLTVVTATDGNHGRSVAWGARKFGCRCKIYIHAKVSKQRAQAMTDLGAEVIRVSGNYDASVHQVATDAATNNWFVVSDTSYAGYEDLPRQVMAGYSVMTSEIIEQLQQHAPLTHVFVQGGVGGLAGAVCGQLWREFGRQRPRFTVVEPERADCLFQSALRGRPTVVDIKKETMMAGLSCGEVSPLAWNILDTGCDDFMTVSDDLVAPSMRQLSCGGDDPAIVAGESAVAGLAGLLAARRSPKLTGALGLDENSRVLVIGTEGATDPEIYRSIVGRSAAEILVNDL
ncbi:MAG: diaminopropionate ammonia-lyase [Gammaproteobacteria bacterium]|nr:diaminopropionate ammonia-lyase [Gammaproteobacteria bacterium]